LRHSRRPGAGELALCFVAAFLLTIALQWRGNAYRCEWTSSPDEPAHYVTGLLARDYLVQGLGRNPYEFAQRYYRHYPKVALGHWPPAYYALQAAWTIPFGVSRTSLLLMQAVIGALLLTAAYALLAAYFPAWLAWAVVMLAAAVPDFQQFSRAIMAEPLVALLSLCSLLALARYFAEPRWQTASWFGLLASATLLTKATGIALAPVPLLTVLLLRRWEFLKRFSFWLLAFLVLALCGPWYAVVPGALHERVAYLGGSAFPLPRLAQTFGYWAGALGLPALCLAAIGLTRTAARLIAKTETNPIWPVSALFLASTIGFRMTVGAWESRHLLSTIPMLALLACSGLAWILKTGFSNRLLGTAAALVLVGVTFVHNTSQVRPKVHLGLDAVAQDLAANRDYASSPLLIVSDSVGEGVFIAEVAARERRPGHVIERGYRLLAQTSFMGNNYSLPYADPFSMMRFLEAQPDRIIVLDSPAAPPPHVELVRETLAKYDLRWQLLGSYPRDGLPPSSSAGMAIKVYRLRAAVTSSPPIANSESVILR
jgi:MFS family permease